MTAVAFPSITTPDAFHTLLPLFKCTITFDPILENLTKIFPPLV